MANRPNLSPPPAKRNIWAWHTAKITSLSADLLMKGERRLEGETYLSGGYGIRLTFEAQPEGWTRLGEFAQVWQPSRLKGIQVSPGYGTPFLAATQVFDLRPVPRKFLALSRTDNPDDRFVTPGMILVTRSGSVGRATLAHKAHENTIISDDLLRVRPRETKLWGWLYAYLRAPQVRAMMNSVQYGHIIKHLEVAHLSALPIPVLRDELQQQFTDKVKTILDARNQAYELFADAEQRFEEAVGILGFNNSVKNGFSIAADDVSSGRRRMEGAFNSPSVHAIRDHFTKQKLKANTLSDCGFNIWLPNRFKRIPAQEGIPLVGSSELFEINPDITKRIVDGNFGGKHRGRVQSDWLLLARSGQIYGVNGSLQLANKFHEDKIISDHVIRIEPTLKAKIRTSYVYVALSHPTLGRPLVKALAYGSSIPEIDVADVEQLEVVRLDKNLEEAIANLAEQASALFAKADILENEIAATAEAILDRFLVGDRRDVVEPVNK